MNFHAFRDIDLDFAYRAGYETGKPEAFENYFNRMINIYKPHSKQIEAQQSFISLTIPRRNWLKRKIMDRVIAEANMKGLKVKVMTPEDFKNCVVPEPEIDCVFFDEPDDVDIKEIVEKMDNRTPGEIELYKSFVYGEFCSQPPQALD